jgi:hypothetical protein
MLEVDDSELRLRMFAVALPTALLGDLGDFLRTARGQVTLPSGQRTSIMYCWQLPGSEKENDWLL